MALRTDIDVKVGLDGSSFECFPTSAFDCCLDIIGMNAFFHFFHLSRVAARNIAIGCDTYATPESVVAGELYINGRPLSIIVLNGLASGSAAITDAAISCLSGSASVALAGIGGTHAAHGLKYILVIKGYIDR